jgi:hypothetical protein
MEGLKHESLRLCISSSKKFLVVLGRLRGKPNEILPLPVKRQIICRETYRKSLIKIGQDHV